MRIGRNEECWCSSGRKYKYCHLVADRERVVTLDPALHPAGTPPTADFRDDLSNILSGFEGQLAAFCKDAGSYFFHSATTVGQVEQALKLLHEGSLEHAFLIDAYRKSATPAVVEGYVHDACANFDAFAGRETILLDAISAHFDGKYTLSVPVLFAQLEGVLRKIGKLKNTESIKPTIPRDIWNNRLLFSLGDRAKDFNAFVTRLYEGQKTAFNRNPILHGVNLDYNAEENSLVLILCLIEIRTFLWFERNTDPVL